MTIVEHWLAEFDEIVDAASLTNQQAREIAVFLRRYAVDIATVVECRRDPERELVVVDLMTGAPQTPVYPIRPCERIGILFLGERQLPFVTVLRDDFPDTEHQQIVPEGHPAVLCIDDRPWAEARLTWTPAELLERILSWFRRAARGELQDARQPLDPILMGSFLNFIVARSILDSGDAVDLIGEHDPEFNNVLRVKRAAEVRRVTPGMEPVTVFAYRIPPEQMRRLRYAPSDLAGLAVMLNERGINLLNDLVARLTASLTTGEAAAWRLNARAAVIVEMPIRSPREGGESGIDMRAFVTALTAGDIAVRLGIALKQEAQGEGSKVGYVKAIGSSISDAANLTDVQVQSAEVHFEFERDLAARLAGRGAPDTRKAVLVGAGAIGSHIADCLIREGRFTWTIVDDDRLLPHNLARHIGRASDVSRPKAAIVAEHMNAIMSGNVARSLPKNLFDPAGANGAVGQALLDADLIIDTSASVVVSRAVSDCPSRARCICAFFNPSGEAAVLMVEPDDRSATLRDLEAQYFGLILRTPRLADHLGKLAETIAYTGACRAITNRIPQSRAALLSGLAADRITSALDGPAGSISVWTLAPAGGVVLDAAEVESVRSYKAVDWTISIDAGLTRQIASLRKARLPSETGGMLFGLVDIPAKRIHLVDATPAPPDSIEEPSGFIRGMGGVDDIMQDVQRRTAGQVRYIGEWHSHPPRMSARPSLVDTRQLDWLAALMGMDSLPGLMVIAADRELNVIFAAQRAEPLSRHEAA
jgi:E2/UBC family protein A/ThiF family protein/JAB domain-containing protein similar to deubiquitination enzymes